jgi:hypothetical protein
MTSAVIRTESAPLRVLIVEDSEEDAELIVLELKRGGYDPEYLRVDEADAMRKRWISANGTWCSRISPCRGSPSPTRLGCWSTEA